MAKLDRLQPWIGSTYDGETFSPPPEPEPEPEN